MLIPSSLRYGMPDDDTLENSRDKVKIKALAGNDDITNNGKSVTIKWR